MAIEKGDFIEIEFTGKVKGGDIFDSNIKDDLEKANIQGNPTPFIFAPGYEMFVTGADKFLVGKDVGEYNVELKPEEAFGKRDRKLIQMVPLKNFIQSQINPIPGVMFNFDGRIAKVLTVSGGRVMVDFNNPIAGKDVEYKINVKRKVEDINEKVRAMNDFFFRQDFEFGIKGEDLILKVPKGMAQFISVFADKYKEILKLNLKAEEVEQKAEEKK
jgi:FKBP-type peptidyl-prolyl cis-trans isomerase 2